MMIQSVMVIILMSLALTMHNLFHLQINSHALARYIIGHVTWHVTCHMTVYLPNMRLCKILILVATFSPLVGLYGVSPVY